MSRLILLPTLLILAVAAANDSVRFVRCPEVQANKVCSEASAGFGFFDGCNRVRCTSGGVWSTRRYCPFAETPEDFSKCRRLAVSVLGRMDPLACPNVKPELVCAGRGEGFRFSDGCNGVTCSGGGTPASSTMRACPEGNPEGAFCKFVESRIGDDDGQKLGGV